MYVSTSFGSHLSRTNQKFIRCPEKLIICALKVAAKLAIEGIGIIYLFVGQSRVVLGAPVRRTEQKCIRCSENFLIWSLKRAAKLAHAGIHVKGTKLTDIPPKNLDQK